MPVPTKRTPTPQRQLYTTAVEAIPLLPWGRPSDHGPPTLRSQCDGYSPSPQPPRSSLKCGALSIRCWDKEGAYLETETQLCQIDLGRSNPSPRFSPSHNIWRRQTVKFDEEPPSDWSHSLKRPTQRQLPSTMLWSSELKSNDPKQDQRSAGCYQDDLNGTNKPRNSPQSHQ